MIRFIYRYTVTLFSGWHQVIVGFPPYRFQLDVLLGKIGVVSTQLRSFNYIAEAIYLIDFLGFLLLKNLSEINRENTNVKTEAGCFFYVTHSRYISRIARYRDWAFTRSLFLRFLMPSPRGFNYCPQAVIQWAPPQFFLYPIRASDKNWRISGPSVRFQIRNIAAGNF